MIRALVGREMQRVYTARGHLREAMDGAFPLAFISWFESFAYYDVPWGGSSVGFIDCWKDEWFMGGIRERESFHVLKILGFVGLFEEYARVLPRGGAVMNGFKEIHRVRLLSLIHI